MEIGILTSCKVESFLLWSIACFTLYHAFRYVSDSLNQRRKLLLHGCKPVPRPSDLDPFFGIDFLWKRTKQLKKHTWLDFTRQHFNNLKLNTCQLNTLGNKVIFTIDPENIKAVHQTNFKSWGLTPSRINRIKKLAGVGILIADGHQWQQSRKLLRPSFERSRMDDFSATERHLKELINSIPSNGTTVDLRKIFHTFTLNSALDFLLGDSSEVGYAFGNEFEEAFDRCLGKLGGGGKLQSNSNSTDAQLERDVKLINDMTDQRIAMIQSKNDGISGLPTSTSTKTKPTFIQHLLAQTNDQIAIRSELLNNIMAGRDTTASLLTNVFFEISKHPCILSRLRQEIQDSLHGSLPTYTQLQTLKYTRAILNESMRLHPQIVENARMAIADTILPSGGGVDGTSPVFVPKGQILIWSTYALHRRTDIYGEDANEFVPDRWLDTEVRAVLKPGWGYLAFGGGPRICMGQQFALLQASYVMVRLIQTFTRIESRDAEPWTEQLNLVCNNRRGCKVAMWRD